MESLIKEYRSLMRFLQKDGKRMSPQQRRALVSRIIRLEKIIVKKALKMIASGNLDLDISQFPPRIRNVLQKAKNTIILRKISILLSQELDEQKHELQIKHEETQRNLNLASSIFTSMRINKARDSISYLVKLQRTENENSEHNKKTLEKIKKTFQK